VVRELLTRGKNKYEIIGTAFWMRFVGSLIVMGGACFYSLMRDPPQTTFIVFLLSISIIFQSFTVIDFYFQSEVKGKFTAISQLITLFVSAIIKLVFIFIKAPLEWFATMAAFEAGFAAFTQFVFYKKEGQMIRYWRFNFKEAKLLLYLAIPLILSSFVQMLYQNADTILIARFLRDMGQVGQYGAGARISQASYFIPVAICAAVFPGIVNNRDNKELQIKRLTQLYSLMIWGSLTIITGGMIFGDLVIGFLYGAKFPAAPHIFKIHIWLSLPIFWGTAWGMWMLAMHEQKYLFYLQLINATFTLASEYILIPRMGITGAAYALLIGSYFTMFFILIIYKPREGFPIFLKALNPRNILEVIRYSKK
jgi:O-antigen/teichoic acid export membrane protein